MGPECGQYVPSGWFGSVSEAYYEADEASPDGAKILIFVTPGNYTDEFVVLGFNHSDVMVSGLWRSVLHNSIEASSDPFSDSAILIGPITLTGGFYQIDNESPVNLTLVGIRLESHESYGSPLYACVQLLGVNSVQLRLNASTLYCPVHVTGGAHSSVHLHWSSLLGVHNNVSLGPRSSMDAMTSTLNSSTFLFQENSTVLLSYAYLTGRSIFHAHGEGFRVTIASSVLKAEVNVSAGDKLTLTMTQTVTSEVFHVTTGQYMRLFLTSSIFGDYMLASALKMQAQIFNNTFVAHERARQARNQLSAGNLILLATCNINMTVELNTFYNGTMFLVMQSKRAECNGIHRVISDIHYNIFPNPPRIYRFADILREPAVPALGFFPIENLLPLDTQFFTATLNATQNYWGDPSGPFQCCVPDGKGAFTTNQVDTSDWCLDASCSQTSNVTLSSDCVNKGCPQRFLSAEKIVFWIAFSVGLMVTLSGLAVEVIWVKRTSNIGNAAFSDVSSTCFKMVIVGAGLSMIGCLLTAANILPLLISTERTDVSAHQERVPFRCIVIMVVFLVASGLQCLFSPLFALALRVQQRSHFRLAEYMITPMYLWNVIVIDAAIILSCWWVPFSGFNEFFDPFFLTQNSSLAYLVLVPGVLLVASSLVSIFPIHILISRTRHYEYSRLNDTIDEAILEIVRHEPELEESSHRLRQWISISIVTGFINILLSIFDIIHDPYATSRYIIVVVQICVALLTLGGTIYLTFAYYRIHLIMVSMVGTLMWLLGTVTDLWFWGIYAAYGDDRLSNNILHIFSTSTWGICLTVTVVLLYRLRESTLRLLPAAIAANLNYHLDRSWNTTLSSRASTESGGAAENRIRPSLLRDLVDYSSTDAEEFVDEVDTLSDQEASPLLSN
jgi:hypothetical protein